MRRAIACFTLLASTAYAVSAGEITLRGYTPEHATAEMQWEQKFREMPDPAKVRENMRRMSARPHHVGSPYDKDNAEWLVAQLKSYGLDAKIEQFEALFPTPKSRKLELLGPEKFEATLDEPIVKVDPLRNGPGLTLERLIPYDKARLLQGSIHNLAPGGSGGGLVTHEGEEVAYIIEGQVELIIGEAKYLLNAGDSICYRSEIPHGYKNASSDPAKFIVVNTPPSF